MRQSARLLSGRTPYPWLTLTRLSKRTRQLEIQRHVAAQPGIPAADPTLVPASRKRWFRLVALLVIPLGLLLCVEGALRLAGYGYSPAFFRERGRAWIENRDFGRRFFPPGLVRYAEPFNVAVPKPPNTVRVFVLGESAAMGDPDFKFGLPRMLEVLLRERFPQKRIEVVNTAMVAINSHVILPIARDCADKQADLWVIYMGNNEMIGPYGSASVFGARAPALPLVRAGLWLKTTRLGQLADGVLQRLWRGNKPVGEWSGMEMMSHQKVSHTSAATQRVYRHFERNLMDLLTVGVAARVPIVLCTVADNLSDCAPFASLHRLDLTGPDLARWQTAFQEGITLQDGGHFSDAKRAYEKAAQIDGEFAELQFRRAECCRRLDQNAEAETLFGQARDQDALQFRADGPINEIIRRCAAAFAGRGVRLLDAAKLFATNSPQGLTGAEFFYEHVHLTPEGNYLLGRAVARRAAEALSLDRKKGDWASMTDCLRLLGLTDWNRYQALEVIADRIAGAPFTNQVDHSRQLQRLNEQLTRLRVATKPAEMRRAAAQVAAQVERHPDDPALRWNLAALLQTGGDAVRAERHWRALIGLQPQADLPKFNLAQLLEGLGRENEALPLYADCVQVNPENYAARYELGTLCFRMGRMPDAIRQLRLAVGLRPQAIEARLAYADALAKNQNASGAEKQLNEVLRLDPNNAAARQALAELGHGGR